MAMPEYKKFPYRLEFPDSDESARSHQSLEDALQWARWRVHSVWRETNEHGAQGDYITDAGTAVITNRNTGYRWILRRDEHRVEFQTAEMYEGAVAHESIQVHLTIEEAEALARAANAEAIQDKRTRALVGQALDQIALLCRQVRERVRFGDAFIDAYTSSIPRKVIADPSPQPDAPAGKTRTNRIPGIDHWGIPTTSHSRRPERSSLRHAIPSMAGTATGSSLRQST